MAKRSLVLPVLFIFVSAACGGSGGAPTAPGGTSAGASISGTVIGGGSSALTAASAGHAVPGLIVTVAGTSISSGLDAAGRFLLKGVPTGDARLEFSGPVTATITLANVQATELIDLAVSVSAGTVTLESQARSGGGDEQLEGRIESLPPTMPAGTLKVAGRTVATDSSTQIRSGGSPLTIGDLEIGYRVHVTGHTSGGNLLATSIQVQNTITTIPVNVNGVIDSLTGDGTTFEFRIGSRIVRGDSNTEFFGDGNSADSFDDLANGARVEVKGLQRDGYVYAERIHINGEDDDDDEQEDSASIHGALTAIAGGGSDLTLTVGGTIVRTSSGTVVKRRGDVQTLAELRVGQDLHVIGTRQADGSIDARRIEIGDDSTGGEVEISGSAGGVSGTCPTVRFGVNGYSIRTTATTTFDDLTCAALKSGTKVTVKGTSQADNSVVATLVKAR